MSPLSRRKFIYVAAALPVMCRFPALAEASSGSDSAVEYPQTISILQRAHRAEKIAAKHYIGFTEKALQEQYPNTTLARLAGSRLRSMKLEGHF